MLYQVKNAVRVELTYAVDEKSRAVIVAGLPDRRKETVNITESERGILKYSTLKDYAVKWIEDHVSGKNPELVSVYIEPIYALKAAAKDDEDNNDKD